jgi:hypothetical protein
LRLQAHHGFFASEVSRVLRGASRPFGKGEVVQLSNMSATVTEITTDGRPVSVAVDACLSHGARDLEPAQGG